MKTTEKKHDPRAIKFAEAGILLAVLLSLVIFIGVKMNSSTGGETVQNVSTPALESRAGLTMIVEAEDTQAEQPVAPADATETVSTEQILVAETDIAYDQSVPAAQIYQDGERAYYTGDYAGAADIFSLYTERRPGNAWGYYMFGLSLHKAGFDTDASLALQTALQIKPDHIKSLLNLARVHLDLGDAQAALPLIEKAVDLQPDNAAAWRMLGRVSHNLKRIDEAIAAYDSALRIDPDDAWALNNLGLVLIKNGRSQDALPALARAVITRSDVACFHNNLGIALERSGYVELAADTYRAALDIDPDYAKAGASLARIATLETQATLAPLDLQQLAADFTTALPDPTGEEIAAIDISD